MRAEQRRPGWIRPLLVITTLIVVFRFTGLIDIPAEWLVTAIALDVALGIFELTVFVGVYRYFYRQRRRQGYSRVNAWVEAEIDELETSGIPGSITKPLKKLMFFEINVYRKIYRFFKRR
jgi:hypothetical protein